jgi:hypothetical protein
MNRKASKRMRIFRKAARHQKQFRRAGVVENKKSRLGIKTFAPYLSRTQQRPNKSMSDLADALAILRIPTPPMPLSSASTAAAGNSPPAPRPRFPAEFAPARKVSPASTLPEKLLEYFNETSDIVFDLLNKYIYFAAKRNRYADFDLRQQIYRMCPFVSTWQ